MAVSDSATVTVNAPQAQVLAFLRNVDNQKNWMPGCLASEVLEKDAEGRPKRARLTNDVKVAKDTFELDYTQLDDGFSWVLSAATKMQTQNNGSWKVVDKGAKSDVTFSLTIDTPLPLPGFVQKKTLKDTLKGTTQALTKQF